MALTAHQAQMAALLDHETYLLHSTMSHIVRLNITLIAAVLALCGTVVGSVWAVAVRDSDLQHIQGEVRQLRSEHTADHEQISDVRGDIKAIREMLTSIIKQR